MRGIVARRLRKQARNTKGVKPTEYDSVDGTTFCMGFRAVYQNLKQEYKKHK